MFSNLVLVSRQSSLVRLIASDPGINGAAFPMPREPVAQIVLLREQRSGLGECLRTIHHASDP